MKKAGLFVIYGVYAVIVASFGVYQHHQYQKSFEEIVPYSHTIETQPTETISETETALETQAYSETIQPDLIILPTETILTLHSEPIPTTAKSTTIPKNTTITTTAVTEPIEPIQEEIPEIPDVPEKTEFIVNYPLNLNTATLEELCTLPEIGEVIAQAIIDYREQIGGFINRQQLLEVSGIGEHRYSVIFPYLIIENEQPMPTESPEPEPVSNPEPTPDQIPESEPIPTEPPQPEETTLPTEPPEIPYINLNTVTKEQLLLLPDCTEEIAESIIQLREIHIHTFSNPLEILFVNDIARKTIIPNELYFAWEEYLFVDDTGGKQLDPYGTQEN